MTGLIVGVIRVSSMNKSHNLSNTVNLILALSLFIGVIVVAAWLVNPDSLSLSPGLSRVLN